jgi:hypothetical protein
LNTYPELTAVHAAVGDQLIHDILRQVGGNRKTNADISAVWREDLRVDADQLGLGVD